jgi:hypothetical protein
VPRVRRGGSKKRSPSRVGGLGSKARSRVSSSRVGGLGLKARSQRSSSHVGGLGSKARSRSRDTHGSTGGHIFRRSRIRRPISRPMSTQTHYGRGIGYPRRYRSRPTSSCGCFTFIIILAIIWLIFVAPLIVVSLNATLALVLPIIVVVGLFIVAIWFITKIVDDGDDEMDDDQVRVVEHETILVVCPYCGAKNEQGITTCANCDAEI